MVEIEIRQNLLLIMKFIFFGVRKKQGVNT